jgi:hypothetical protein
MAMNLEEPRVMRELHELRAKHYEKTKYLTPKELAESINEGARKIAEQYNLKFKFKN